MKNRCFLLPMLFLIISSLLFIACNPGSEENHIYSSLPDNNIPTPTLPIMEIDVTSVPLPTETPTLTPSPIPSDTPSPSPTYTPMPTDTPEPTPKGLIGGKYDVFYDEEGFQKTDMQYISDTVSISVTRYDHSPLTRHLVYFVADIYIQNIKSIRTGSWDENFGTRAINGKVYASFLKMARRESAITAITGDYYTYNINTGLVFRNGKMYQTREYKPWKGHEILFLKTDGTMFTVPSDSFDINSFNFDEIWQAWEFGPSLLDDEGIAKTNFNSAYSTINRQNPRTIIGYYEPGHYCFVTVDGRKTGYSNGLTIAESALLMESLGCKLAFNLDGGQTSQFYWNDQVFNKPYNGGRFTSDIIYIIDTKSDGSDVD